MGIVYLFLTGLLVALLLTGALVLCHVKKWRLAFDGIVLFTVSTVFVMVLDGGASLLKGGEAEGSPLVSAILKGADEGTIRQLGSEPGAQEFRDEHGRTPLMVASYINMKSRQKLMEMDVKRSVMVRALLSCGANVQDRDKDGWTALMWAAWSGLPKVTEDLLSHDSGVNDADRMGNTPLIIAAQRGNSQVVRMLLQWKADPSRKNASGRTALDYVQEALPLYSDATRERYAGISAALGVPVKTS